MENKKLVFPILTVLLGVIVLFVTGRFVVILLSSFFISYLIKPLYEAIKRVIRNKTASAFLAQLIFASIIIIAVIFVFNSVLSQLRSLGSSFMRETLLSYNDTFIETLVSYIDLSNPITMQTINNVAVLIQGLVLSAPMLLVDLFLLIFFSFYFVKDMDYIYSAFIQMIPVDYRRGITRFAIRSASITKDILYSYFLNALVAGLLLFAVLLMIQSNYALDYAVFNIIASLFPVIGTWIVPLFLTVYYTTQGSYVGAFIMLSFAFFIAYITTTFRRIIRKKHEQVHPLLFIIGVFVGFYSLGFLGFLTGPIVFGVLQVGFEEAFKQYYNKSIRKV